VSARVREAWRRAWFSPATPLGLIAARTILAAAALWIVLSRPDLPELLGWPREFWRAVSPPLAWRFLIVPVPLAVERGLFVLLHVCLAASVFGVVPRLACFASGLLLYHFAPLENVFSHSLGPYFNGLTLPLLGLLVLSFARRPRWSDGPSEEYRWPLTLIRVLLSFNYVFSALAKLQSAGLTWVSADNIREMIIVTLTYEDTARPVGHALITMPTLCLVIAVTAMLVDLGFVLAPFSRRAAAVLVPIAFLGHVGIALVLGIVFLSAPYLLLFLDWDRIAGWLGKRPVSDAASPV
jgi:hypothetical protein